MKFYYILKDGQIQGRTANRENAIAMIRDYQKLEKHPILKAEFSIIAGEEEIIQYEKK